MLTLTNDWTKSDTAASVGLLAIANVVNVPSHPALERKRQKIENHLRDSYGSLSRDAVKTIHPMDAYIAYYKSFGYTYHVLPQLESIVKGKSIPRISALVTAMFMAELNNMMLTAGHNFDALSLPLLFRSATGNERYTGMNGKEVVTVPGDWMIADQTGVISSILRGPDQRTRIKPDTKNALFTVYAPARIDEKPIRKHLCDIESYVRLFSPDATILGKQVYAK